MSERAGKKRKIELVASFAQSKRQIKARPPAVPIQPPPRPRPPSDICPNLIGTRKKTIHPAKPICPSLPHPTSPIAYSLFLHPITLPRSPDALARSHLPHPHISTRQRHRHRSSSSSPPIPRTSRTYLSPPFSSRTRTIFLFPFSLSLHTEKLIKKNMYARTRGNGPESLSQKSPWLVKSSRRDAR